MTQVLFGEKLIFADDPDFWRDLEEEGSRAQLVSRRAGKDELCYGMSGEALGDTDFILCQLDNHHFNSLDSSRHF